ncbi:hypothetical protein, partial [Helicobacter pylori]|uniref:hypothetical protein n=1 Tax=Helicobacter pylori TaxID=210 RepID=UPI001EE7F58E
GRGRGGGRGEVCGGVIFCFQGKTEKMDWLGFVGAGSFIKAEIYIKEKFCSPSMISFFKVFTI